MSADEQSVVIADDRDIHVEMVQRHLSRSLVRIDLASVANGVELSYEQRDGRSVALWGGQELHPSVAWWYQPRGAAADGLPLREIVPWAREYARAAVRRHTNTLSAHFVDTTWVSDPYAMDRADNKPLQLKLAAAAGIRTPATLQTSDPGKARAFVAEHIAQSGACIVKTTSNRFPVHPDRGPLYPWSRLITHPDEVDYDGLRLAPAIFQQLIYGSDVRVTVVGTQAFPAKITASMPENPGPFRDWRIAGIGVDGVVLAQRHELPPSLLDACVRLNSKLGIRFSAIDFIVDRDGVVWFLEDNTVPAFAFIEHQTRQPISKALARLLTRD